MTEAKIVQMEFDLFEVCKINNLPKIDFVNFLLSTRKEVVKTKLASNGLPVFKINANNIKPSIKKYNNYSNNIFIRIKTFFLTKFFNYDIRTI